jgi:hypothetical protein
MTPAELKQKHIEATGSNFFDRKSLAFFGDTMRNYGVRSTPCLVYTPSGDVVKCWELYRKKPVKHGLCSSAYFDVATFRRVHSSK